MKSYEELVNQVKDLIRKNKTDKALELLAKEQLSKLDKQLILINSRYSKLKEDQTLGILDDDTAQRNLNKINVELLALADKIGKKSNIPEVEEPVVSEEPTPTPAEEIKKQTTPAPVKPKSSSGGNSKLIGGIIGVVLLALVGYFGMQKVNNSAKVKKQAKIQLAKKRNEKIRQDSIANAKKIEATKKQKNDDERKKKIAVGNKFEGGIIYYVDETGLHGLIMSQGDQTTTPINWFGEKRGKAFAFDTGIYAGLKNTDRLIKKFTGKNHPAQLCANFEFDGYKDWYLPSQAELDKLYEFNRTLPRSQRLKQEYYWSSTELNNGDVYYKSFFNGKSYSLIKGNKAKVRAIRQF
jgi:hypothetical protein